MAIITKARPFMLLWVNDFLSDPEVMLMDSDQFSWYMRMLMQAWKEKGQPRLKNDEVSLMIAAKCGDKTLWREKSELVLRKWKVVERGKYLENNRLNEEFSKMCGISEKRSRAAHALHLHSKSTAKPMQTPATQMSDSDVKPKQEPKAKPSANATPSTADERHTPFIKFLEDEHQRRSIPFAFDGWDAKELGKILMACKSVPLDKLKEWAVNKLESDEAPDRPRAWLPNLPKYSKGPLDRFGKPKSLQQSFTAKPAVKMKSAQEVLRERDEGR